MAHLVNAGKRVALRSSQLVISIESKHCTCESVKKKTKMKDRPDCIQEPLVSEGRCVRGRRFETEKTEVHTPGASSSSSSLPTSIASPRSPPTSTPLNRWLLSNSSRCERPPPAVGASSLMPPWLDESIHTSCSQNAVGSSSSVLNNGFSVMRARMYL